MTDTQDLILQELRSLREDFHSFSRQIAERVSVSENDLHGLLGNGQPGRIANIERTVSQLSQWRWWLLGAAAGSGGVVSVIAWVVTKGK